MAQNQSGQIAAGNGPCNRPDCKCCASRIATEQLAYGLINTVNDFLRKLAEKLAIDPDVLLQVLNGLVSERRRCASLRRRLNAEASGIKIVTVKEESSGKIGRPKGQPATITARPENIDREETNDMTHCPGCGKATLSEWSDEYETVVGHMRIFWENVLHRVKRRYCRNCKAIVPARIPGRMRYARTTANYGALMTLLNIRGGISHGKLATVSCDALKRKTSRSSMYRSKISISRTLAPDYELIRETILKEPNLHVDELWWPIGRRKGMVLVALGKHVCMMEVMYSRNIKTLKGFLDRYGGILVHDSYTGWFHIGSYRQLCIWHQMRLVKRDLTYLTLDGETTSFLNDLMAIYKGCYDADKTVDLQERIAAADRLDSEFNGLMNAEYADRDGHISRYQKRFRREGGFLTTYLREENLSIDNNPVEQMNRKVVCVRDDGGGNRSEKGMRANTILFTAMATDLLNDASFFDHIVEAASGDRTRISEILLGIFRGDSQEGLAEAAGGGAPDAPAVNGTAEGLAEAAGGGAPDAPAVNGTAEGLAEAAGGGAPDAPAVNGTAEGLAEAAGGGAPDAPAVNGTAEGLAEAAGGGAPDAPAVNGTAEGLAEAARSPVHISEYGSNMKHQVPTNQKIPDPPLRDINYFDHVVRTSSGDG